MKVLVTGGAGFIASHVVDAYIDAGHDVTVVDDLSTGKQENLNPRARFHELDIRSPEIEKILEQERPQVINHHAAQMDVRRAVREPDYDASVNVIGALNILENGRRHGTEKVIFASTGGAVYGEPESLPVTEDHPIAPLSPYGLTKFTFEQYLALYGRLYDTSYTVLRYPNVYGPRQDPHGEAGVVAIFTKQLLDGDVPTIFGDGSKTRDYVHVSDVVKANLLVLELDSRKTYNLGWGREISDRTIFDTVCDAVGTRVDPRFEDVRAGEIRRICLDRSRIEKELGWSPTLSLPDGIADVVASHRKIRQSA